MQKRTLSAKTRIANMLKSLRIIKDLDVATPCGVRENCLSKNKLGATCSECDKQVYDLTLFTKLEALILYLIKRGKFCIKVTKDQQGRAIYKQSHAQKLFLDSYQLLCKAHLLLILFLTGQSLSAENSKANIEQHIDISRVTYGDVRVNSTTRAILGYVEGSFGALLMVISFLIALIYFVMSFIGKKPKFNRRILIASIFIFVSMLILVARTLVSMFFSESVKI